MDELKHIHEPSALAALLAQTAEINFTMASEPKTGAVLRVLAASKLAGRMLELGTGTGVGTAWLLAGMDAASRLTRSTPTRRHKTSPAILSAQTSA